MEKECAPESANDRLVAAQECPFLREISRQFERDLIERPFQLVRAGVAQDAEVKVPVLQWARESFEL